MTGPSTHNTIVSFSHRKATGSVIPRAREREIVVISNKLQKLSLWFFTKKCLFAKTLFICLSSGGCSMALD